ncbi:MAG: potassium channel protein [Flavobacteriales bacterium]|nr:potassium channel protein [Flavobacteriales bacterium]
MKLGIYVFSKIYSAILFIFIVVAIAIVGYMYIEDYSLSEAVYMTVITLSTVGFQEVRELSPEGRLFTTFLIITSFGTFAYAVSVLTTYIVSGEFNKYFKDYKVKKDVKQIENHVVVCGYGRNGSQAVKKLFAHEQDFVVIDNNPERIEKLRDSKNILFINGDATLDETLEKAGISKAKALITSLASDADNLYVVLSARQKNKDLTIISRASFDESYSKLKIAGANNVIMPDKLGGAHMASLVTTPDVVEFLDNIALEGDAEINLDEISFEELPVDLHNKTIKDINARYKTGCNIIGYKTSEGEYVINPNADTPILPNSKLFVLANTEQINHLYSILNLA